MYCSLNKLILSRIFLPVSLLLFSIGIIAQREFKLQIIPVDSIAISTLKDEKLIYIVKDGLSAIKKLKEISEYWISKDYIAFSYDSICSDSSGLKSYLALGPKFSFDSLKVEGIPENLLKLIGIRDNKLKFRDFIKTRENIVQYYENNGFPFAFVKLDNLSFVDNNFKVNLSLVKNGLFKIDSIIIKGNPKISRKFLLHHIQIKPGNPYNQSKIDNMNRLMNDLSFIKQAKPAEIEFRDASADLYLYLKNYPANFFSGIIGFANDSVSNSNMQITGDINLILLNSFKIGEKIDFYWNRYNTSSQKLRFGLQFPYIFVLPVGFSCRLGLEKFQTNYLNTELYTALNYEFSGSSGLKAYIQNKKSFIIDTVSIENSGNMGFSSTITGLGFSLDKTDYKPNPLKGYFLDATMGYGNTTNEGQESRSIIELGFEGGVFIKAGKQLSFAFLNKSSGLISNSVFYKNQIYKIGGINTLRGFDEQSIFASTYSIFSFEPRLLSGKNSSFFVFSDVCWYEYKLPEKTYSDWPIGFGAGMNIDTKAGIFKLVYAVGKQQGNPIKLSNSKVHFGFSTRF
jgi:outer membrane protein assembly factor BamA